MPLKRGSAKSVIRKNIQEMVRAGHSVKSSVAAAMKKAGKSRKRKKGRKKT